MYHFPHSYALFPINLRIPVNIPTYPPSRTHTSSLAHLRVLSHAPTHPLSRTHASSLTHPRIFSHAPTHPHPLLEVDAPSLIPTQSLTSTNISSELRAPTSPSPRTYSPYLYAPSPSLMRRCSITYTYSTSHQRKSPANYAHLPPHRTHSLPYLYAPFPSLIRRCSTSYTYILDHLYVPFRQIL